MKLKLLIIIIILLVLTSCSSNDIIETYQSDLLEAEEKIVDLQNQVDSLRKDIEEDINEEKQAIKDFKYTGGLLYCSLDKNEGIRFVKNELNLLALPYEGAPIINRVFSNSIVTVLDKVSVNNEIEKGAYWYYVIIPVYDSPMDYKGWVRLEDTVEYNEDNYKELQSDVKIRIGAGVIESFEFPDFKNDNSLYVVDYELSGRLEERKEGYVRLNCAGGMSCWVKEEDIIFPEVP